MGLKETEAKLEKMLHHLSKDLVKAKKCNKAAMQRVRTGTIKLAKVAKTYRRESVAAGKKKGGKKKPTTKRKATKRKATKRKAPARRKTTRRKATKRKATKRKAPARRKTTRRKATRRR